MAQGNFFLCADKFALPANARNKDSYIIISMKDVAYNDFRHLFFLPCGNSTIIFGIRNTWSERIG